MQLGSTTSFCATPAISPRLLIALTPALGPPSIWSLAITPFRHTNGRHWKPLKKAQKFSSSDVEVSATPAAWPLSLTSSVQLFGPLSPVLAMSSIFPLYQTVACSAPPGTLDTPPTKPLSVFPRSPTLNVP